MVDKDGYRRYLDAAAVLGQITRARAEELVREMMGGSDVPKAQAQWVDEIVERGRKATEDLVDLVRAEVSHQLEALGLDADDLARQAADILRRSAEVGRRVVVDAQRAKGRSGGTGGTATAPRGETPSTTAGVRKGPGTAAKKTAAKKATTKKTAAKKATTKKTAAKKATATKKGTRKATAEKRAAAGGARPSSRARRS